LNEKAEALRQRLHRFAVRLLKFLRTLPHDPVTTGIVTQLARSGPAVSANYHATCRSRSRREFIAKLGVVVEEADETEHWLKLSLDSGLATDSESEWLYHEARELRAILKASLDTARRNYKHPAPRVPNSPNP
jgi:four helix bundle protein